MRTMVWSFLLTTIVILDILGGCRAAQNGTREKEVFYLLTLLPYYNSIPSLNPSWNEGNNIQPALNLAVDQINKHDGLLENFNLQLIHGDSGCDKQLNARTIENFVSHGFVQQRKRLTGIIGPGCSSSSGALASLVERPELGLVVVHGAGSPTLANRTKYPYLLGTLGSTSSFVQAFYYLVKRGNWSRIAILYDISLSFYINTKKQLFESLENLSPEVAVDFLPVTRYRIPLKTIKKRMLRVVFVMCPLEMMQYIMCLASNMSMNFSSYQWVIMPHTLEELTRPIKFWLNGDLYACSTEKLKEVYEKTILLNYNFLPRDNMDLISNQTHQEYQTNYEHYRELYNLSPNITMNSTYTYWATYFYDAVWAWAVVLDNLTKTHEGFNISSEYGNINRSEMIVKQFYKTSFQGISGQITFSSQTGFVWREVTIFQVSNFQQNFIAFIDPDGKLRCKNEIDGCNATSVTFIDDSFPSKTLRESQGLAIFFVLVLLLKFFIIVMLHIITAKYSNSPSLKASSPKLLHMSYIGVYILVAGTFLWDLNSAAQIQVQYRHYFCQVLWAWTIPVGFTLSFSPVVMRTWRIYRIFKHYLNPGHFISNRILVSAVMFLIVLNLIVAVIWTTFDRFELVAREYPIEMNTRQMHFECTCKYLTYWRVIIGVLEVGLLILVAIFSVLTRGVAISYFATSSLRVFIYLLSFTVTLVAILYGLIIHVGIQDKMYYFSFSLFNILLSIIIGLFIMLVFIPPIIPIFRNSKTNVNCLTVISYPSFLSNSNL